MKIALTGFVTLDGVSQGPGSPDEDTSNGFTRGGWLMPHIDRTFVQRTSDWLDLADGLLLGRRTYEAFARPPDPPRGDTERPPAPRIRDGGRRTAGRIRGRDRLHLTIG